MTNNPTEVQLKTTHKGIASLTTTLDAPRQAMPGGFAKASARIAERRLHKQARAMGRGIARFSSKYIDDETVEVKAHLSPC